MKKITFSLTLFVCVFALSAQKKVALQNNGSTTVFQSQNPFIDAYNAAVSGDTIYLPGGQFNGPNTIDKRLTVFGAGHHPDSTQATGATIVNGFTLLAGSDKSHFEGLRFTSGISFSTDVKIDSVTIRRSNVPGINILGTSGNKCVGIVIHECVVDNVINAENASNVMIVNNFVRTLYNLVNSYVANNIIATSNSWEILYNCNQNLFENNILGNFYYPPGLLSNCLNNSFVSNVFSINPTGDTYNNWSNNHINVDFSNLFVNWVVFYSYSGNYSLQNQALYQGTTGNQIGMYGGIMPAKNGHVPANPHISEKNISFTTNAAGELNVNMKVQAQDF